jgi:hypothetical protein
MCQAGLGEVCWQSFPGNLANLLGKAHFDWQYAAHAIPSNLAIRSASLSLAPEALNSSPPPKGERRWREWEEIWKVVED